MNITSKVMKKKWGHQIKMNFSHDETQGVVFLALDGWDLSKYENREGHKVTYGDGIAGKTTGQQIRFSINGPLRMTHKEWLSLVENIEHEYQNLRAIEGDI